LNIWNLFGAWDLRFGILLLSHMVKDKIQVMLMLESDIDAVVEIEQVSFADPWKKSMFLTELKEPGISIPLVIKDTDTVIGYAVLWQVMDEMHLGNFAVKPEYRKKRIGSQLLQYIIDMAVQKKVIKITLEVRQSNTAAIALYQRFGFKAVAIRRGFYTKPTEDGFVMLKSMI
jgi:[ribosomal protein S18]-alanine N-acetyltransferase